MFGLVVLFVPTVLGEPVTHDGVRLRSHPFLYAPIVGQANTGDEVEPIARTAFTQAIGDYESVWLLVDFDGQTAWMYGAFVRIHASRIPDTVANYPASGPVMFDFASNRFVYMNDQSRVPEAEVPSVLQRSSEGGTIAWVAAWNYTYKDSEWEEMRDVSVQRTGHQPVVVRVPNTPDENSRDYRLQLSSGGSFLALFGGIGWLDQVTVVDVVSGTTVASGVLRSDSFGQDIITMYAPTRRHSRDQLLETLEDTSIADRISILQDDAWFEEPSDTHGRASTWELKSNSTWRMDRSSTMVMHSTSLTSSEMGREVKGPHFQSKSPRSLP